MNARAAHLFISYRKADTGHAAGRLYADLQRELAPGQVFLDKERLEGGDLWPERLRTEAERATVMLVLIGERWLKVQDSHTGDRRLNVPDDWVRTEIETGLQAVPVVVPVLVDGAEPLTASTLRTVPSIEKLAGLQTLRLRDEDWPSDIETLMKLLHDRGFEPRADSPLSRPVAVPLAEPTMRLAIDRITPLSERQRGKALVYGTVALGTGDFAYGKGLVIQLTLENLSEVAVVVKTLDLVVDEHDEHPLEDYDYDIVTTSGMRLEIPDSDLPTVTLPPVAASGAHVALASKRYFLAPTGTHEAQHTLTARVVADSTGIWKLRVCATYVDAGASFDARSAMSDAFFIALK
jgi:hypothetical protein